MVSMLGGAGGALDTIAGVGIGIADLAGVHVPAMLRCVELPPVGGVVWFDFNPKKITFSRSNDLKWPLQVAQPNSRPTPYSSKQPQIELTEVVFTGETTKMRCDTLLNWMAPAYENDLNGIIAEQVGKLVSALSSDGKGPNLAMAAPTLTFQWGPPLLGFMYSVQLSSVTVNYTRFDPTGIPIRAELTIRMGVLPSLLSALPTNPTSGGQPGRRTHVVGEGETLASVAQRYYARPGLWRRIAEVNGIDDPRKVRPGRTLYLPNANELTSGG